MLFWVQYSFDETAQYATYSNSLEVELMDFLEQCKGSAYLHLLFRSLNRISFGSCMLHVISKWYDIRLNISKACPTEIEDVMHVLAFIC